MALSKERAKQLDGGIWLIGLGILFYTRIWWPGIMFVLGVTSIVEGLVEGRGWYSFQGGLWCIAIGLWAYFNFHFSFFFIALGASMVIMALVRPPALSKPKPLTDNYLE